MTRDEYQKEIINNHNNFLYWFSYHRQHYAFWTWTSNTTKNVVFNASRKLKDYIIYNEGNSTFSGNFETVSSYIDGMYSTISIYKTSEAANVLIK